MGDLNTPQYSIITQQVGHNIPSKNEFAGWPRAEENPNA